MSNDSFNNSETARAEQERLRRQNAELQRDVAINSAANSQVQRDAALNVAADQAQQRDVAAGVAGVEAVRRHDAEQDALAARTAANQASYHAASADSERNILRENLSAERANASNANFGFYMMAFCILAALIGLGIWYFNSNPVVATTTTDTVAVPASSTTTITQPSPPVNINVQPSAPAASPPVIVNPAPQQPPNVKVDVTTPPRETPPASDASKSDNPGEADKNNTKPDTGGGGQ